MSSFNNRLRDLEGRQKICIALSLHLFYEIVRSFPNPSNLRGKVLATIQQAVAFGLQPWQLADCQAETSMSGFAPAFPQAQLVCFVNVILQCFFFPLYTSFSQASPPWVAPSCHPCPDPKPVEILGKFPQTLVVEFWGVQRQSLPLHDGSQPETYFNMYCIISSWL